MKTTSPTETRHQQRHVAERGLANHLLDMFLTHVAHCGCAILFGAVPHVSSNNAAVDPPFNTTFCSKFDKKCTCAFLHLVLEEINGKLHVFFEVFVDINDFEQCFCEKLRIPNVQDVVDVVSSSSCSLIVSNVVPGENNNQRRRQSLSNG